MKLLGILTIWRAVVDWCLTGSFLQLLSGHYSVRFGYQREQIYTEIVLKHVFLIKLLHIAKYLVEIAGKVICKKETSRHIKFLEPTWNIVLNKFWVRI